MLRISWLTHGKIRRVRMAALMTIAGCMAVATQAQNCDCIRILGYSTVRSWYGGEQKNKFEARIADESTWELLFAPGSIISKWADPKHDGWYPGRGRVEVKSPCKKKSGDPDMVLISVASKYYDSKAIEGYIKKTIANVHNKYKHVKLIILQPQIGGVDNKPCTRNGKPVRDSRTHPYIDKAIGSVAASMDNVVAGMSPEVRTCADWSDNLGHIKSSSTDAIGKGIADFYNEFFKKLEGQTDVIPQNGTNFRVDRRVPAKGRIAVEFAGPCISNRHEKNSVAAYSLTGRKIKPASHGRIMTALPAADNR